MSTDVHLYRRDEEVAWTLGCMACPVTSWEPLKTEHSFHCLFLNPVIVLFLLHRTGCFSKFLWRVRFRKASEGFRPLLHQTVN